MKKSKDAISSQLTTAEKQNLVACLASAGITHVEITCLADDTALLVANGTTPSPRTAEAEVQDWYDVIHAQPNVYGPSVFGGTLKVLDRAVFCGIEGIFGFSFDTGTPIGTAASAPTDGNSTWMGRYYRYLYNHVTTAKVQTGDILCPIPEITGQAFSGHWFTDQGGAISLTAQMKILTDSFAAAAGKNLVYMANPNFSEVSSGFWSGYPSAGNIVCYDYYGNWNQISPVTPAGYIADLSSIFAGQSLSGYGISTGGIPQLQCEWGDLSGSIQLQGQSQRTGDNFISGTTSIEAWHKFLIDFYKAYRDNLVPTKLIGFNYWGGWENQNTSILWKTGSGAGSQYFLNTRGQILAAFYKGNGLGRIPVNTNASATYSEADPSFGGRDMYY